MLAPGNIAYDWSSYAQWEKSLEALRAKRCLRLKIRHLASGHTGQGRVLGIYERAVGRHPGSSELWREYLQYTAHVKASKRWRKTMTNALRMMPTDAELWIMAGTRSAKNGDMASARGFFMRGCRFCTKECRLWIEYARAEMEWLEKMERKKGIEEKKKSKKVEDDDEIIMGDSDEEDDELDSGLLLPEPTKAQAQVIDRQESKQLANNPAMDGAIPMAIFEISCKQPFFNADVAEKFYAMAKDYPSVSSQPRVAQHILRVMDDLYPNSAATCNCRIREPILGINPGTAQFPHGLQEVVRHLDKYMAQTEDKTVLKQKTAQWINEYLKWDGLDEDVRAVLNYLKTKHCGDE